MPLPWGVDGDHIDVFLSEHPETGDVFVVDRVNDDGSFDEHKVMYGFGSEQEARDAYLSNYDDGWTGLGNITHVSKEEFKKWIESSKRKTKPFAEYKSVKDSGSLFQYFEGSLRELILEAKARANGIIKMLIAPVSNRLQDDLSAQGMEITGDYNHVIDNNAIRHALKQHGSKSKEKRGQIPLTDEDFERIVDIVRNYDEVRVEFDSTNAPKIIYSKSYSDGTTIYVEENRSKRKELAAVTMWKHKKTTLTDAKDTATSHSSDLGGHSEGKDSVSADEKQVSADEKAGADDVIEESQLTDVEGVGAESWDDKYREEAGDAIEELFNRAVSGELSGKPVSVGLLTTEGREYLERLSGMKLKPRVDFVLNPSDLLHIYRRHFGENETDGRNIPLTVEDIREMSDIIACPDRVVFAQEREGRRRKLFFFIKESARGSYNLLEVYADRRGNLTSKSFFKSKEGVSQRVISLLNDPTLYVHDGWVNPLAGAKLPIFFERTMAESRELSAKEYDAYRGAMEARVRELADKLGVEVRIVTDEAEAAQFENPRRRKAKGWYDHAKKQIVVVMPNHSNVADAEETIVHEAVAHFGLRKLIGNDKFEAFLDEVFAHASDKIKADIARRAQTARERWIDAETRRRGGGAAAAAYATVEAEARKDSLRRTATEEYMADMAEKIAYDGFEKMGREEQTLWGRVKAKVMKLIEAILRDLKIGKSVRLTDKDIAYILYRSWRNLRDGGIRPTALDIAEDVVMRARTGYDKTGGSEATTGASARNNEARLNDLGPADSEHFAKVREKIDIAKVAERFDSDIERYERGELPTGYRFELGMPSAELRSADFPNLSIVMRSSLLARKAGDEKHPFEASDLKGLVNALQHPIAVFRYTKENIRNVIVASHVPGSIFLSELRLITKWVKLRSTV